MLYKEIREAVEKCSLVGDALMDFAQSEGYENPEKWVEGEIDKIIHEILYVTKHQELKEKAWKYDELNK